MMNPIPHVKTSSFYASETLEAILPRRWDESTGQWLEAPYYRVNLRFKCPHCHKRHRAYLEGFGVLPKSFKALCEQTKLMVQVVRFENEKT